MGCFCLVFCLGLHHGPYWQSGDVFEVILRITFLNAYIHMFTLNTALLKHSSSHRPFRNCVSLMLSDIRLALLRLLARIPCGLDMGTLARSRGERGRDRHTYQGQIGFSYF